MISKKQENDKAQKKQKKKAVAEKADDAELQTNLFSALNAVDEPQDDLDLSAWVSLELSSQILESLAEILRLMILISHVPLLCKWRVFVENL